MSLRRLAVLAMLLVLLASPAIAGLASASSHLSNAGPVSGPGPIAAPNGPTITVTGSATVNLTDPTPDANTLQLYTSEGNATFSSPGPTEGTVAFDDFSGAGYVNVTALDVSSNALTVDTEDDPAFTVSGDTDSVNVSDTLAVDDGNVDFVYAGASGTTTLTLNGLPSNTQIAAFDVDTNTVLAVATSDGSGQLTLSGMSNSEHTVKLVTSDGAPIVDNTSATPTGGLSGASQTLSINVSDPDFPNDNVTVEFFKDGSSIGTTSLTSNGTASMATSFTLGGTHTWHVEATDAYGNTTTSSTFTVQTPNELRILNESAPTELVDNATVELRFYVDSGATPQVYTRNTSDGTVNMTGLPATEPFIVVAETDGYFNRRIFVPSLYETQKVFLLPTNATAVPVTFSIEDYSGQFPQENTVLTVQRALNGSYQTVLGDFFGATGQFPATLAYNQRHRLELLNIETGQTRSLGSFTPQSTSSQRVVVSPTGEITVSGVPPTVSLPDLSRVPARSTVPFNASIQNGSQDIQSWTLTVTANGTTLFSDSGSGPAQIDTALNLSGRAGQDVTASMTYTLADGSTGTASESYTVEGIFNNDDSLLGSVDALSSQVPQENRHEFNTFLAMIMTVVGTAVVVWRVPMGSEFIAVIAWLFLAAFAVIGWVSYDWLFVSGLAAAALAYVRRVN